MANVFAVKSGSWSDPTVWNTGALPTSVDDVFSNGFTITIDISPIVSSVRNTSASGINSSGTFNINNGITLTATNGILAGQMFISCVTFSGNGTAFVNASILASSTGDSTIGLLFSGSGILNITGNVVGGSGNGNSTGLRITSGSGTLNLVGNITAGSQARGCHNTSSATVNITGNITGAGSGSANSIAMDNSGGGTVNITGSCTSTGLNVGVNNVSTGTINITGTCTGGSSTGSAFVNSSTGTITHIGTAQASATAPAIGAGAAGQVTRLTGPFISTDQTFTGGANASGVNPCVALRWFPRETALSTFSYTMRGEAIVGSTRPERSLYFIQGYSTSYPAQGDVRLGVSYAPSNLYTGTCAVPPASSVISGVPVDNTVGTAAINPLDIWNVDLSAVSEPGSVAERLKNSATIDSTGAQIAALGGA